MAGFLSGLLGIAALPPLSVLPAGLIWMVPWLSALHGPPLRRVTDTVLAIGLPIGFAIGPVLLAEPGLTLVVTVATLVPFILTALLAADRYGQSSGRRLAMAVSLLCGLLAGARELGPPISLSLFLPADFIHLPVIGVGGILAADLAIALPQATLAVVLNLMRTRAAKSAAIARLIVALLALLPLSLVRPPTPSGQATDQRRIAVIQTQVTPQMRQRAIANGGLETLDARHRRLAFTAEQLDADWIVWPEATTTGFFGPDWQGVDSSAIHLRHGYAYHHPGRVSSEVRMSTRSSSSDAVLPRWRKHYPLPFAERDRIQPAPAEPLTPDISALEVLICSDATHPVAVDIAAARRPRAILNPASLAYLGSIALPGLHQRSVHLQAARIGIPMIVVANAGPSAVLYPDGGKRVLTERYTSGVAVLALPDRYTTSDQNPGVVAGFIVIGFIALGGRRIPVRPPDRSARRPAWLMIGLAAASIGIATALQLQFLEGVSATAMPAPGTQLETRAIESPRAGHRGSIALLAREFGVATDWRRVPASPDAAMVWLCQQTGLIPMDSPVTSIRPPAFALQQSTTGLRAVRWRVGTSPVAFDPVTGRFESTEAADPAIHWLATARTRKDCRSVTAPE